MTILKQNILANLVRKLSIRLVDAYFMLSRSHWVKPISLIISLISGLIFLGWLGSTVLPVVRVELSYQYNNFLKNQLHITSLKTLFIPNFSGLNFTARTTHKTYGIVIPKLFIDEPVIFNTDPNDEKAYLSALKQGIAQASGTAFPDQPGLGYYFAHSSHPDFRNQYNAVFYLLNKLEPKDDIYIWHESKRFRYQVTEKRFTQPNDVSFLHQKYDQETIVLQTCWPPGTSLQRLLVFATRINDEEKE